MELSDDILGWMLVFLGLLVLAHVGIGVLVDFSGLLRFAMASIVDVQEQGTWRTDRSVPFVVAHLCFFQQFDVMVHPCVGFPANSLG